MEKDNAKSFRFLNDRSVVAVQAILAVVFFLIAAGLYKQIDYHLRQVVFRSLQTQANQSAMHIQSEVDQARDQIRFLQGLPPISGIVRASANNGVDPLDNTRLQQWKVRLKIIFIQFLRTNNHVRQVRYIGAAGGGLELVRVDRKQGRIKVIPDAQLQGKGNRAYFKAAEHLSPGKVYISNVDLNREHGVIEQPSWPTFRAVMGVYDSRGGFFGAVIVNYDVSYLLNIVRRVDIDGSSYLLNQNGDYLVNPNRKLEFAFERGAAANWLQETGEPHPVVTTDKWRTVNKGSIARHYVAATVNLDSGDGNRELYVVTAITEGQIEAKTHVQMVLVLIFIGGVFMGALVLVYLYQRALSGKQLAQDSELRYATIIDHSKDAIVTLGRSGRVDFWNEAARRMLGYSPKDVETKRFSELVVNDQYAGSFAEFIQTAFSGHYVRPMEIHCVSGNNEDLPVMVTASLIHDDCRERVALILQDMSR